MNATHQHTMDDLRTIPFSHSLDCLCCRKWRGGHKHYGSDHPGLETLLFSRHGEHSVTHSTLEVD